MFCHWKSTDLLLVTQSEVVFFYLNIKTKKIIYESVFFFKKDDVPMTWPARAGSVPEVAVGGPPGRTKGELGGLSGGGLDEDFQHGM